MKQIIMSICGDQFKINISKNRIVCPCVINICILHVVRTKPIVRDNMRNSLVLKRIYIYFKLDLLRQLSNRIADI